MARLEILKSLLGNIGDDRIIINPPFYCDYGKQISVGRRFFANFNFTVLDEAPVAIGDDCFIGPNVSIFTACHSTDPAERNSRRETMVYNALTVSPPPSYVNYKENVLG